LNKIKIDPNPTPNHSTALLQFQIFLEIHWLFFKYCCVLRLAFSFLFPNFHWTREVETVINYSSFQSVDAQTSQDFSVDTFILFKSLILKHLHQFGIIQLFRIFSALESCLFKILIKGENIYAL